MTRESPHLAMPGLGDTWSRRLPWYYCTTLLGMGLLLLVTGCAPSTGTVTGKVWYQDKPVTTGFVTFLGEDGRVASGPIQPDGSYSIAGVPACAVTITVDSMPPAPLVLSDVPREKQRRKPPEYVRIPRRYAESVKSGLKYEVRGGEQTYDIKLEP